MLPEAEEKLIRAIYIIEQKQAKKIADNEERNKNISKFKNNII